MTSASLSRRLALLAALASSLWLAACGGDDDNGSGQSNVRAINLTADLPSIDLYTGDTRRFAALAADALAPNQGIEAATYTLNVKRAGEGATLFTGSYALSRDAHYTAVVWGRETALRLSTLPEDEDTAAIATGNARVRFFNATSDTGSLDVYLTSATADLGETAVTQGALTSGTLSGFRELSRGTYRLRVTGAGDPNDLRLDIASITLGEKQFGTLVLTAGAGGVLVNGTLVVQQGAATALKNNKARVRIVASMNNAGNVAASIGTRTLAGGLRSPSVGPYTLIDAGSADLTVRVNGSVIATGARTFAAGADYTLLTYGADGAGQLRVLTDDNRLPTTSGTTSRVKVRLLHGVQGVDPLTLSIDYSALVTDIASGTVSGYATLNSNASALVDVTSASGIAALYSATEVNLQGQGVYTVFMLSGNTTPTGVIRKDR